MRILLVLLLPISLFAQEATFTNPILSGGYPDPSIVRVEEDYYIVNSSFEYFPGLPIHKSSDLINWELIGYGLHRTDQCDGVNNLVDVQGNGGIHAPTIRHKDGVFYIITTNIYSPENGDPTQFINFIITATNPAGPWSDPHIIDGAPGIDPDLFFDDDEKVYFVGTHDLGDKNANGIGEIWVQELDLNNWKLVGERTSIWAGACGGCCVEGPHMYKQHGMYYIMVAEGGTAYNHAVMIAASDKITGPFEANPRNPILTTRHLSHNNWVHSTGHADMVELPDGRWYMVALGKRGDINQGSNMGRETHLIPVDWEPAIARWVEVEEGKWEPLEYLWPVCAPETGKIERSNPLPFEGKKQYRNDAFTDNFDHSNLDLQWNFRRVPRPKTYSLDASKGFLRLYAQPTIISERERASLMGIRQRETDFEYQASMIFKPKNDKEEAGISLFQKDDNYINWTIKRVNGKHELQLVVNEREKESRLVMTQSLPDYNGKVIFKVVSKNDEYNYQYSLDGGNSFIDFTQGSSELIICHVYTGAYMGIYASSNGNKTKSYADFDWVKYQGFQRN